MITSQIYILISIIILAIIAVVVFFVRKNKKQKRLSKLAGFSFGFVIAGITFGDTRCLSYSLMGIGIILAVIDIFLKLKKKE